MGKMREINSSEAVSYAAYLISLVQKEIVIIQWQPSALKLNSTDVASWLLKEFLGYAPCFPFCL